MSREDKATVEGLVTSDAVGAGAKGRRLFFMIASCLAAVALLGAGGWYIFTQTSLLSRNSTKQQKQTTLSPAAAIKQAQEAVSQATTAKEKAAAYTQLGQAYMSNDQPKQAISSYQQALDTGSSSSGGQTSDQTQVNILADLGDAYDRNGQIDKEIAVLQQIEALLKKSSDADDQALAVRYQALINQLKGL